MILWYLLIIAICVTWWVSTGMGFKSFVELVVVCGLMIGLVVSVFIGKTVTKLVDPPMVPVGYEEYELTRQLRTLVDDTIPEEKKIKNETKDDKIQYQYLDYIGQTKKKSAPFHKSNIIADSTSYVEICTIAFKNNMVNLVAIPKTTKLYQFHIGPELMGDRQIDEVYNISAEDYNIIYYDDSEE